MVFSKLLPSGRFGELGTQVAVQSAVFCKVQGCNSVTKIGDISNMKCRLSTSYKYKIPRSFCNLYVFKDLLSRYLSIVGPWVCVNRRVQRLRFLRAGCLCPATLLMSADACMEITTPFFFFFHAEAQPFGMSEAEVAQSSRGCVGGAQMCRARAAGVRGRWALGVTVPPRKSGRLGIFSAVSVKTAVGGKGLYI